ncbi:MAG: recombinase, partial [Flavobacterium sp.]
MKLFPKSNTHPTIAGILTEFFGVAQSWRETNDPLEPLVELIGLIRPKSTKDIQTVDITEVIVFLQNNFAFRKQFSIYLAEIFANKKFNKILADAAILQDADFFFEVKKRIFAKFLPYQPQKDTLEY